MRWLADAVSFSAREPRHSQRLTAYTENLRDRLLDSAAHPSQGSAAAAFDGFAGIPTQVFSSVRRESEVARLHTFVEQDALRVLMAQHIGWRAVARGPGERSSGCSPEQEAPADAFAFDIVRAARNSASQGQFPAYAMLVILDANPRSDPRALRSLQCRARYFAHRASVAARAGQPGHVFASSTSPHPWALNPMTDPRASVSYAR